MAVAPHGAPGGSEEEGHGAHVFGYRALLDASGIQECAEEQLAQFCAFSVQKHDRSCCSTPRVFQHTREAVFKEGND